MQWVDFAAFAWRKYLSEGRGAVVVDLLRASKSAGVLQVPTYYVAEESERLSYLGGWPNDEIAEVVSDYDPEQDVVFLFNRLDGDVFHYNASDELTPPNAYQSKREAKESRPSRLSFDEPPTAD
jgi:hypothetical protein